MGNFVRQGEDWINLDHVARIHKCRCYSPEGEDLGELFGSPQRTVVPCTTGAHVVEFTLDDDDNIQYQRFPVHAWEIEGTLAMPITSDGDAEECIDVIRCVEEDCGDESSRYVFYSGDEIYPRFQQAKDAALRILQGYEHTRARHTAERTVEELSETTLQHKPSELTKIAQEKLGVVFPEGVRVTKDVLLAALAGRDEPLAVALRQLVELR